MTKSALLQALMERLQAAIAPDGFMPIGKKGFKKRIVDGEQRIGFAIYDYFQYQELTMVLTVRLNAVESILSEFRGVPERKDTVTLAVVLENLVGNSWGFPRKIGNEADLERVVSDFLVFWNRAVRGFFEANADCIGVSRTLNKDAGHDCLDHTMQPYRAMTSLTVAKVARCPDFDHLAATYKKEIEGVSGMQADTFEKLVGFLRGLQ